MEMDFDIIEFVSTWILLPITVIFIFAIVFAGFKSLLSIAARNLGLFFTFSKVIGLATILFGLLLLSREDMNWKITLLEIWTGILMMNLIPIFVLGQAAVALSISWFYWIHRFITDDTMFFEILGDSAFFLIFPTMFILTILNFETRIASFDYKFFGPRLPITKYI